MILFGWFVHIEQGDGEVTLGGGIGCIFCLHADAEGGPGLVVQSGRGFQGTVGGDGKEGIVPIPYPANEGVGNGPPLRDRTRQTG